QPDDAGDPGGDREDDARAGEPAAGFLVLRVGAGDRSLGREPCRLSLRIERLRLELDQLVAIASRTEDRGRRRGGILGDRPGIERRLALEVGLLALFAPAAVALESPFLPLPLGVLHWGTA